MFLDDGWKAFGMFNCLTVHVSNIDRAIGTVCQLNGPKPIVGRAEQFTIRVNSFAAPKESVVYQVLAVHEIASYITD